MSEVLLSESERLSFILPDGSQRIVSRGTSLHTVAESIGSSVARNAVYAEIDGSAVDLDETVQQGGQLNIITLFDEEALMPVRHSCLLLLALVVKQLYPTVRLVGGQMMDNGFHYDFASDVPFTTDDLSLIEERMAQLIAENPPLLKEQVTQHQAKDYFLRAGEDFKSLQVDDLSVNNTLKICHIQDHVDIIEGPVVPDTRFLKYFRLLRV